MSLLQRICIAVLTVIFFVRCDKELNEPSNSCKHGYDFQSLKQLSSLGEFNVVISKSKIYFHSSHGLITSPLEYNDDSKAFNFNDVYALKDKYGEVYYFKFGWVSTKSGKTIFEHVVWLEGSPILNRVGSYETFEISPVKINFLQKGDVSVCTVGDSQTWWNHAKTLRCLIKKEESRCYFSGSNNDLYGYPHEGEGGNSTVDVLDRISFIPKADYYTLLLGTNDWENNIDSTLSNLIEIVTILSSKSPESKIIYMTPLPTTNKVRDAFNIELSEKIIQYFSDEPFFEVLDIGSEMRNEFNWARNFIDSDGLHQSPNGVIFMAKLIGEKIRLLEGWE